jgi:cbb3-type cytochrome oxidase subunit 3
MIPLPAIAMSPPSHGLTLRDIHLPPNPSWWPPAPGWWGAVVLLLALLCVVMFAWRRRRRRGAWQHRTLAEIDALAAEHADDDGALAAGLHQLLRRAARRYEAAATQQRGEQWRQTLACVSTDTATLDALMMLEQRMYRPLAAFDRPAALAASRRWLQAALRQMPEIGREARHA